MTEASSGSVERAWRLDSGAQTLVFASLEGHLPEIVYWGPPLAMDEDLDVLSSSRVRPLGRGTLDRLAECSICPEEGRGYPGVPGITLRRQDGSIVLTQFHLSDALATVKSLTFQATDSLLPGVTFEAHFEASSDSGVIRASSHLSGAEENDLIVDWIGAPALPLPATAGHVIDYAGRWTKEFGEQRVPLQRGLHVRESRRGRTGHDHFPALLAPDEGSSNTLGIVRGLHLGWSGNHRVAVEELADGRRMVLAGSLDPQFPESGSAVRSPDLYLACSTQGLNGLAEQFQAHVRRHIVRLPEKRAVRPVHYNCWEAVYFDHDLNVLKDLANRAANLGAERFVLDDGWFGKRDDDTTSLGDWTVDARKYPNGLNPLIDHVRSQGMEFGLWVEPEMVNLDSDLARAHPDWILMPPGRVQLTGRGQHVLNLTIPDVAEHLFTVIDGLLNSHAIDYLKWDMNRDLTFAVDNQGHPIGDAQTRALYQLLAEIRQAHRDVEIESCASGGGRIDYGILGHTHRVWLSDSNDARERWRMQLAAFPFLPPEIIGSHVGPRICHTSGRVLPMGFRAMVAMMGHMGFEMDLRDLTAEEAEILSRITALYKAHRPWMHAGTQHRLKTGRADTSALMVVSETQDRFLIFAATLDTPRAETTAPLPLAGVSPSDRYRLHLVNGTEIARSATRAFDTPLTDQDGMVLTGSTLMQAGIVLPLAHPDHIWLIEGQRLRKT